MFSAIGIDENGELVWKKEKFSNDSINHAFINYNMPKKGRNGYYCFPKTDWSNGGTGKFSLLVMDSCFNTIYFKDTMGYFAYIGEGQKYTNGDFYFCGQMYDTTTIGRYPVANCVRIDSLGNVLWNKLSCNTNVQSVNRKIIYTSEGNILLGGEYNYGGSSGKWMLTKLDTTGNIIWQNNYGHATYPNGYITGLLEMPDGSYLVSGCYPAVSLEGYEYFFDGCLCKISADGEQLWRKRLRSYTISHNGIIYLGNSIKSILISDGYIYVLGSEHKAYTGSYNSYLIKMDLDGNILWKRIYYGENAFDCSQYLNSFDCANDGGFIMGGSGFYGYIGYSPSEQPWLVKTDSLGIDGLTNTSLPELNVDIEFPDTLYCGDTADCMLRLSGKSAPYRLHFSTGQTIDSIFYPSVWMPPEIELGEIIIGDELAVYGRLHETEATYVDEDFNECIYKPIQIIAPNRVGIQQITIEVRDFYGETKTISKEINVIGDCELAVENIAEQSVSVYPNPATESITVVGENISAIEICNLFGSVVYEMQSSGSHNVISTDGMPAGSYFVKVKMADGKVVTKKIVVIK